MSKSLNYQKICLLATLYTSQYLGLSFFMEAFIAILRQNSVPLENLGFIYMIGIFLVIRFLWAPFIDRFSFKKTGHYKGWIIVFQSLMVITLVLISMSNIFDNLLIVSILVAFFSFFSASQNIALDALVFKTVSLKGRPLANAIKSSGGMVGMMLGGGAGLILYHYIGWYYTLLTVAFFTALGLIQVLFYKEPKKELDSRNNNIDFRQYIDFWKTKRRKQWLFFLIIYPIAISSAYGLIIPMLVDLKWELHDIGLYVNIIGYGIGVLSAFSASWFINKYGKRKILIVAAIGQVLGVLLLLLFQNGYTNEYVVMLVVGFVFSFYAPSSVVLTTLMMDESSQKTPASQFAIQHSIYMFSGILSSGFSVSFSGIFGYSNVIICVAIIGLIALYASFKIDLVKK